MSDDNSYLQFAIHDGERFDKLAAVFAALKVAKATDDWHDDAYWKSFFDDAALAKFWWPTDSELQDWARRWKATPIPQRWEDPSLKTPWDFGSLIDAFRNGEYELRECRRITSDVGRLEFFPFAFPYGGKACMEQLIQSFGLQVVGEHGI